MVATPSTMLELGTAAPDFSLPDTDGNVVGRGDFDGRPLLVVFMCPHCPYVRHVAAEIAAVARDYADRVGVVGIMSNDIAAHPDDHPDRMAEEKEQAGYVFPYLYDETQEVAKQYRAACTPDFFLFDADHRLVYRGQLDDSRPRNDAPINGKDLRAALDALLAGDPPIADQKASMGCNIKWKPGNEPAYF